MIKAKELTQGNIIAFLTKPIIIHGAANERIYTGRSMYIDEKEAEPIPLSEEWLLKMGFTTDPIHKVSNGSIFFKGSYSIAGSNFFIENESDSVWLSDVNVKYVHQLQNLYFALTGEELQIQLP